MGLGKILLATAILAIIFIAVCFILAESIKKTKTSKISDKIQSKNATSIIMNNTKNIGKSPAPENQKLVTISKIILKIFGIIK